MRGYDAVSWLGGLVVSLVALSALLLHLLRLSSMLLPFLSFISGHLCGDTLSPNEKSS
jgi:hypothetical protein